MIFSVLNRKQYLQQLQQEARDLLVIGGGITGAGIALDAQTRGMSTGLIEMQDFSAGTSSRSTKLIHGGLRYLKQFEVKMVAEVGRERAIVYENGPHVTTPEWMLLPFYKGGTFGRFTTSLGLLLYDYLAGVKKSERRRILSADEVLQKEPLIKRDQLLGGGYYVEYRTDDARLTIEVLKKAVEYGAIAVNYAQVHQLIYENYKVVGVRIIDRLDSEEFIIKAKKVVNATGPWVDHIRELDHSKRGKTLHLTKGVHIVLDQSRFPLQQSVYFDAPDNRMIFAIPRDGKTYVGTTDTNYDQDPTHPRMTREDLDYLLHSLAVMFPEVQITAEDVESSWAGIRPLIHEPGKDPSEISRHDEVFRSPSGLISIAGGKLTGYRKMAETIVDLIAQELTSSGLGHYGKSKTKFLPISGGNVGGSLQFSAFIARKIKEGLNYGLTKEATYRLVRQYGSNIDLLFRMVQDLRVEANALQLPIDFLVSLEYSIQYEMIAKPIDFFSRRTGALLFAIDVVKEYRDAVIHYMGNRLQWNDNELVNYRQELDNELLASTFL